MKKTGVLSVVRKLLSIIGQVSHSDILVRSMVELEGALKDQASYRQLLSSGRLRKSVVLSEPSWLDSSWLIFAPHPDDETLGMGGCMLLKRSAVDVIYFSDGEGLRNTANYDARLTRRKAESKKVYEQLGTDVDPIWMSLNLKDIEKYSENIDRVSETVESLPPSDIWFVPHFCEAPSDHRMTLDLVHHSLQNTPNNKRPRSVVLYSITSTFIPNTIVDISDVIEEKRCLNNIWESQITQLDYATIRFGLDQYNLIWGSRLPPYYTRPKKGAEIFLELEVSDFIELAKSFSIL